MPESILDTLRSVFLFESLEEDQLSRVAAIASRVQLQKGEMLFSEGDQARAFFALSSGVVKIFKLAPSGAEFTVHVHKSGDLVAEAAIFDLTVYPAYCQALEPAELLRIPRVDFVELIRADPELALRIMHSYSRRLRTFVMQVEDLSFSDVKARLANYLLRSARKSPDTGALTHTLHISKKELALQLGTSPETLSRTLRALKDEGIIEEQGKSIAVLAPERLRSELR
ncbi:MAG: Crp/Fnr family transcriptional regulator [Ectothiorhodospiraceae bacterium]|nr:Crp/Fnr family transcriptional regulator [Ectothiorhodospiraceae bacterium]